MKNIFQILIVSAVVACFGGAAIAGCHEEDCSIITMNAWSGDFHKSSAGTSEGSKPNFMPMFTAMVSMSHGWHAIGEYAVSDNDDVTPTPATRDSEKEYRYLLGVRYDFEGGLYSTLSHHVLKSTSNDNAGVQETVKLDGFRVGLGYRHKWEDVGLVFDGGIGVGVSNDVHYMMANNSYGTGGEEYDASVDFSYDLFETGLVALVGYRFIRFKSDEFTITGLGNVPSITYKLRGPHLGLGYSF